MKINVKSIASTFISITILALFTTNLFINIISTIEIINTNKTSCYVSFIYFNILNLNIIPPCNLGYHLKINVNQKHINASYHD